VSGRVRVGITLPSFVGDPAVPLAVARTAEDAGVDGVFVFDHLFRRTSDGSRRPALEAVALLGAVAAATRRVTVGTLVLRASLRPPATAAAATTTLARLAPSRLVVGVGAGDSESREENETFGLGFGTMHDRVECLRATVRAVRDRDAPVWVGGVAAAVRDVAAAEADGWNAWGPDRARFATWAQQVRAGAAREPFECSWSGLVVLDGTDADARARANRLGARPGTLVGGPATITKLVGELADAGADWVVLGPVDAGDARTATMLGEEVVPRLG
jgi:alkanesulfonate monooxygenase SsuD/methylene tetrahydromethanopterin reductase-like flavin-dependent oxidoreductase (luciferase family)